MKIATGGISHETSTFTPIPTSIVSAKERQGYLQGLEILEKFRGVNTPIGGFIAGAEAHGFDLLPTIFWEAHPSAPLPREDFDTILSDLLRGIESAGPIDGVLLELHGAMVAQGVPDGEGHILTAVREHVGPKIPIVAQLDIHGSNSDRQIRRAISRHLRRSRRQHRRRLPRRIAPACCGPSSMPT